ncbi:MAG: ferritin family protein [Zoogloeaceae bacterium]|jgi:rubrerythrin|nr:ferritin family protein [Zoogloeaceae bacterium]
MAHATPIGTLAECYANALAIEREATARSAEFAEYLEEHGEQATAELFRRLARFERQHLEELERRAAGLPLPALRSWEFSWLDNAPAEQVDRCFIFHLMTPHDALKIALGAEKRAQALYEQAAAVSDDPAVKRLARELASEELEHIAWLEEGLLTAPRPFTTEADYEPLFNRAFSLSQ